MRSTIRWVGLVVVVVVAAVLGRSASARQWTEDMFQDKPSAGRPFIAAAGGDLAHAHSVIGAVRFYQAQPQDTFLDIARYYGLGYNELEEANPGIDPWVPPAGHLIQLPTEWVLPDAEYNGLVVNIPEMRIYYFRQSAAGTVTVTTYPVGLGRDDWRTPEGKFKITQKDVNPTWVLPESIKAEHRRDGKPAPDFIAGGDPTNPLGRHRMRLSLPLYGIHGTDIPWGVGMQVSHGCVRLYPEDIERLFPTVPIGTPGQFVYQPVKVGARGGRIYLEVHKDIYDQLPGMYREAVRLIDQHGWRELVDPARVERAVLEQSGVPIDITRAAEVDEVQDETLRSRTQHAPGPSTASTRQPAAARGTSQ
jgi:L,D-transpeptidase ErfK/SrfK